MQTSTRDVTARPTRLRWIVSGLSGVAALLALNVAIPTAAVAEPTCTYTTYTINEYVPVGDGGFTTIPTSVTAADCNDTVEVPTTVEIPTTVEAPTTAHNTATVESTAFKTVYDTDQTTVTETENSVVEQTWAFATAVNPATNKAPGVSLSAYDIRPGESLTVSVSGFTPGEQVQIWMNSTPVLLGEATADSNGSAAQVVTMPTDAAAGLHTIRVVGVTCGIDASIPFTVATDAVPSIPSDASVAAASDGSRQLSWTGFDAWSTVWLAAAMMATGLGLMLAARRFRFRNATPRDEVEIPADEKNPIG